MTSWPSRIIFFGLVTIKTVNAGICRSEKRRVTPRIISAKCGAPQSSDGKYINQSLTQIKYNHTGYFSLHFNHFAGRVVPGIYIKKNAFDYMSEHADIRLYGRHIV